VAIFPRSPLTVLSGTNCQRIDRYLIQQGVSLSRSRIQTLIAENQIRLNGQSTKPSQKVKQGDRIDICIPDPLPLELIPEAIPLKILHEDEALLVISKSAGMVVHPAPGHDSGTLVHALLHHCKDLTGIGGRERPGIVHRLDKDTSGVLVVAKTDLAHRVLSRQFRDHSIDRSYLALVCGRIKKSGRVILAIGRDRLNRKKISARTNHPREAETRYRIKERFKNTTLLEVFPQTGRTHQIRVHLAYMGHPVLGDKDYGGKRPQQHDLLCKRQMLHAATLGFAHPTRRDRMSFHADIPEDMSVLLRELRSKSRD